jgi:hypothetical protein
MAIFYWVGGSTGTTGNYSDKLGTGLSAFGASNYTWVRAFDWNNPLNWRTRTGSIPVLYTYNPASRCPSYNDTAIFGSDDYAGGYTGYQLTRAIAPCLWGGAVLSGATTTWQNGSVNADLNVLGTTIGALTELVIGYSGGRAGSQYPFSFLGVPSGFTSAAFGDRYTSALEDASANGFTLEPIIWGVSWSDLVTGVLGATGASAGAKEKLGQLRLRVRTVSTPYANTGNSNTYYYFGATGASNRNHGVVSLDLIKNMTQVGISGAYSNVVNTFAWLRGPAEYRISGYASQINRQSPMQASDISQTAPFYSPRPHFMLRGATVGTVTVSERIGSVLFDEQTNIAEALISPATNYHFVQLQNKFNRFAVMTEIYSGGSAGSTASPNLRVVNPSLQDSAITGGGSPINFNGIILGAQDGKTFSANHCVFGLVGAPTAALPLNINFGGNVSINKIEAEKTVLQGWKEGGIGDSSSVEIGEIYLQNQSVVDFSLVESFDNWSFGKQVGTEIQGGIIFNDETCTIKGSNGIRLWNDQLVSIGNFRGGDTSKRTGKTSTASVLTIE